jgi:hypothetical protein
MRNHRHHPIERVLQHRAGAEGAELLRPVLAQPALGAGSPSAASTIA